MAVFEPAFEEAIRNEGGYRLINVTGDRGGQTYAGVARNMHPTWEGWHLIDASSLDDPRLTALVRDLYKSEFWDQVGGDRINAQSIAATMFDFAVNAGVKVANKLAQLVVEATPDGVVGEVTLQKLNAMDEGTIVLKFALAKVARYAGICNKDRGQSTFLLGWINRTIKGLT